MSSNKYGTNRVWFPFWIKTAMLTTGYKQKDSPRLLDLLSMPIESSQPQMAEQPITDCHQGVIYHQNNLLFLPVGGLFCFGLLCYRRWGESKVPGTSSDLSFSLWWQDGITVFPEERMIPVLFSNPRSRTQIEVNCERNMLSWGWGFSSSQLSPNETLRSSPGLRWTAWDEKGPPISGSVRWWGLFRMQIIRIELWVEVK